MIHENFSFEEGDVIKFPTTTNFSILKQRDALYFIPCHRNGNPCWFPVTYLRRHIINLNDNNCLNDRDKVLALIGKTVRVKEIDAHSPILEYVEN